MDRDRGGGRPGDLFSTVVRLRRGRAVVLGQRDLVALARGEATRVVLGRLASHGPARRDVLRGAAGVVHAGRVADPVAVVEPHAVLAVVAELAPVALLVDDVHPIDAGGDHRDEEATLAKNGLAVLPEPAVLIHRTVAQPDLTELVAVGCDGVTPDEARGVRVVEEDVVLVGVVREIRHAVAIEVLFGGLPAEAGGALRLVVRGVVVVDRVVVVGGGVGAVVVVRGVVVVDGEAREQDAAGHGESEHQDEGEQEVEGTGGVAHVVSVSCDYEKPRKRDRGLSGLRFQTSPQINLHLAISRPPGLKELNLPPGWGESERFRFALAIRGVPPGDGD